MTGRRRRTRSTSVAAAAVAAAATLAAIPFARGFSVAAIPRGVGRHGVDVSVSGVASSAPLRMAANDDHDEDDAGTGDGIAGSFFNPVPASGGGDGERSSSGAVSERKGNDDDDSGAGSVDAVDAFDRSLSDLMKRRRAAPRASEPSTLGGIPTSQATGFGKKRPPAAAVPINPPGRNAKPFVGIGRPLNDINNPEFDDQGYTLYANERTGEKKRVFEALVEYPTVFQMKIVGLNEGSFVSEIVQVVAESCEVSDAGDIRYTERKNGKWTSVTVHAPVKSAEMLYALYESVDRDPRVKFKF